MQNEEPNERQIVDEATGTYEPPEIELKVSKHDMEREVHYAGGNSPK